MFKSSKQKLKSSTLPKDSDPPILLSNKLGILAKLDNMLPGRHSKPSSQCASTSSLVSESIELKEQKISKSMHKLKVSKSLYTIIKMNTFKKASCNRQK